MNKTKQLELEGKHGVFWRIRQRKAITGKEPTHKMIEGHKRAGEKLLGKPKTEAAKQHMSKARLGTHLTEETKQREAHLGTHHTEATKQKQSKAKLGKPLTELHKQHLRDSSPHLSGEKNSFHGHKHTVEAKQKLSEANSGEKSYNYGKRGEDTPGWKGGPDKVQARREEKRRDFGFISLNDKFPGSDAHHLNKELVLYIPQKLHSSVWHNMFTGQGMEEMNNLACEYVYGIEIDGECFKAKRVEK